MRHAYYDATDVLKEALAAPDGLPAATEIIGREHGWAVSERIQQISSDVLRVQHGAAQVTKCGG